MSHYVSHCVSHVYPIQDHFIQYQRPMRAYTQAPSILGGGPVLARVPVELPNGQIRKVPALRIPFEDTPQNQEAIHQYTREKLDSLIKSVDNPWIEFVKSYKSIYGKPIDVGDPETRLDYEDWYLEMFGTAAPSKKKTKSRIPKPSLDQRLDVYSQWIGPNQPRYVTTNQLRDMDIDPEDRPVVVTTVDDRIFKRNPAAIMDERMLMRHAEERPKRPSRLAEPRGKVVRKRLA